MRLSAFLHLAACAAAAMTLSGTAAAADPWPQAKPIKLVISASPGSSPDTLGRLFANELESAIGQTIVVENKTGAVGLIGNDAVVRAAPDGYTLLFTYAATIVGNVLLQPKMPHDPLQDLTPIAQIGSGGNLLVVSRGFPARTFEEFLRELKANPGKYNYASWGAGSGGHIAMESIKQQTGVELEHVPYKAMSQILTDLKGERIQIAFVDSSSPLPMIEAGDMVPIASSASRRAPMTADVPTLSELGIAFNADAWYGLFGPKDIPEDIASTLNNAVNNVQTEPALADRFRQLNMASHKPKSLQAFRQTIISDISVWRDVIQKANITLQ